MHVSRAADARWVPVSEAPDTAHTRVIHAAAEAIRTQAPNTIVIVVTNPLDEIAGIGPTRKRALLHHFGTAKAVSRAGIDDLVAVEGISRAVAELVYNHFHEENR